MGIHKRKKVEGTRHYFDVAVVALLEIKEGIRILGNQTTEYDIALYEEPHFSIDGKMVIGNYPSLVVQIHDMCDVICFEKATGLRFRELYRFKHRTSPIRMNTSDTRFVKVQKDNVRVSFVVQEDENGYEENI